MSAEDHGLYPSPNNFEPYTDKEMRLTKAVEAVLELHHVGDMHGTTYCKECSKSHWIVPAPCPTVAAIQNVLREQP
jgi:hypothetical protein